MFSHGITKWYNFLYYRKIHNENALVNIKDLNLAKMEIFKPQHPMLNNNIIFKYSNTIL